MTDLIDVAEKRLNEAGFGDTYHRRLDAVTKREGIVLRQLPATVLTRYYDGRKSVAYYFQVIVKRRREEQAISECGAIADLLEMTNLTSTNGSYTITSCTVDTEPHEIELNESQYTVWGTTLKALITIKGRTTL